MECMDWGACHVLWGAERKFGPCLVLFLFHMLGSSLSSSVCLCTIWQKCLGGLGELAQSAGGLLGSGKFGGIRG